MADDKGGGGGSEWGALEIIIGILLLIALLDRLTGGPLKKISENNNDPVVEENSAWCGLTVESPKPKEKITRIITLRGYTNGCDWGTSSPTALYAQVIDSKGKPVSGYLAIPSENSFGESWENDTVSFMQTISLTGTPSSGTGYLILIPAIDSGGEKSISARIPLTFSK